MSLEQENIKNTKTIIIDSLQKQLGDQWFCAFYDSICEKNKEVPIELLKEFWKCCRAEKEIFDFEQSIDLPRIRRIFSETKEV